MHTQLRAYRFAVEFHHKCRGLGLPSYLQDQLLRASSSIVLNLAEGNGRRTLKDQAKFFHVALGSLRECQAVLDLAPREMPELVKLADVLGAHLFGLARPERRK